MKEGVKPEPTWGNGAKVLRKGMRPERLASSIETPCPWHGILVAKDEPSLFASPEHHLSK